MDDQNIRWWKTKYTDEDYTAIAKDDGNYPDDDPRLMVLFSDYDYLTTEARCSCCWEEAEPPEEELIRFTTYLVEGRIKN